MKNAIKREFKIHGGKFWENLGSWRTLTFGTSGATDTDDYQFTGIFSIKRCFQKMSKKLFNLRFETSFWKRF